MSDRELLDSDGENRALRTFLMQYGLPGLTIGAMVQHMERSGWGSQYHPYFTRPRPSAHGEHLTKAGAQIWIRHLIGMEPSGNSGELPGLRLPRAETIPPSNMVYVCPERDIECGRNPANWCATCPQRPKEDPRITAFYRLRDVAERNEDAESASIIAGAIAGLTKP